MSIDDVNRLKELRREYNGFDECIKIELDVKKEKLKSIRNCHERAKGYHLVINQIKQDIKELDEDLLKIDEYIKNYEKKKKEFVSKTQYEYEKLCKLCGFEPEKQPAFKECPDQKKLVT